MIQQCSTLVPRPMPPTFALSAAPGSRTIHPRVHFRCDPARAGIPASPVTMHAPLTPVPLRPAERGVLAVVLAGALLLRALDALLWHPFTPDEEFTLALGRMHWGEMLRATAADTHPPLYYALVKLVFLLTPDGYAPARLLSVALAGATLWLIFRFARDGFSPAAGWVALLCASFAPYMIYWQHAARNHQLLPPAVLLIIGLSYRYASGGGRARWWALAAAWLVAIQTNYMALVFGLVWGAAFILAEPMAPRRRARLAATPLPGLLSFVPWLGILGRQVQAGPMNKGFFQETVSPIYLYFHALFGRMEPYQPNQTGPLFLLALLAFALVAVLGARAVGRRWSFWVLLLGLPTMPIVAAKAAGWTLAERHLAFALPVFFVYWGAACVATVRQLRARCRAPGVQQPTGEETAPCSAHLKPK